MLIGRDEELKQLAWKLDVPGAQFVVIYGRPGIGKTDMVTTFFSDKKCHMLHVTGVSEGTMHQQLENFTKAFARTFYHNAPLLPFESWRAAFRALNDKIDESDKTVVIFFDEFPWLASRKSGFLAEFTYDWNRDWAFDEKVFVVASGSDGAWMNKKILMDLGGLYNRHTLSLRLYPLSLADTKEYFMAKGGSYTDKDILDLYMALGGVSGFLKLVDPILPVHKNIQALLFGHDAPLKSRFEDDFSELFDDPEAYREIVSLLALAKGGLSRSKLSEKITHTLPGGRLSKRLKDLCLDGFLEKDRSWARKRGAFYRVVDQYSLFYLTWLNGIAHRLFPRNYWNDQRKSPRYATWVQNAFEAICAKELHGFADALKIKDAMYYGSWRSEERDNFFVIDCFGSSTILCAIRYAESPYVIDKKEATYLKKVAEEFKQATKSEKKIDLAMITPHGVKKNKHSEMLVGVSTLADFFKKHD